MKRRDFGKLAGSAVIAFALSSFVTLTGCAASSVAVAIIASFGKILGLLQSSGILTNPTLVAAAQAALAAFQAAYDAFQKGTGTAEKLAAAAQAALNAVQAFFEATSIGGPIAVVVLALAQIILSTLESFIPNVPSHTFKIAGKSTAIAPVSRTLKDYLAAWNDQCVTLGHPEMRIK